MVRLCEPRIVGQFSAASAQLGESMDFTGYWQRSMSKNNDRDYPGH
jgi:hypothetical protein